MKRKEVKLGETWELGNHRLICADCMDENAVKRLMNTNTIRSIVCDPPYGVAYVENKEHFKRKDGEMQICVPKRMQNDGMQSDEQYANFTNNWLLTIKPYLQKYNTCYIFNSDFMLCALRKGMQDAGWYYSQMIIWVKQSSVVGRKDYMPQHELIAYGWNGRHKMERTKAKSIIFHPRPDKSKLHPTQKPVGLLRKLIVANTKQGEIVYDPFGGSGSTLIACEHLNRKAFTIEIDEEYCSTIIARWEKLTKKEAKKI